MKNSKRSLAACAATLSIALVATCGFAVAPAAADIQPAPGDIAPASTDIQPAPGDIVPEPGDVAPTPTDIQPAEIVVGDIAPAPGDIVPPAADGDHRTPNVSLKVDAGQTFRNRSEFNAVMEVKNNDDRVWERLYVNYPSHKTWVKLPDLKPGQTIHVGLTEPMKDGAMKYGNITFTSQMADAGGVPFGPLLRHAMRKSFSEGE